MGNVKGFLKKLAVVSLVGLVAFQMWGCLDDPVSDEDSVVVTLGTIGSMGVDTLKAITGTITASPAIDQTALVITLTDAAGNDASSHFTQTGPGAISAKEEIDIAADLGLAFTPKSSISSGTYRLTIQATAGTATGSDYEDFTVTSVNVVDTNVVTVHDTLGSWNNPTYGSSLDADLMVVYKVAEASANSAEMDVWYSNEAINNRAADVFYSPKQAGLADHPPKNWTTQNETQMAIVTCDFDTVVNQAQIDAIWAAATDKKQLLRLTAGQVVVLQTNNGVNRLIKFISGQTSDTGICVFKGKKPE